MQEGHPKFDKAPAKETASDTYKALLCDKRAAASKSASAKIRLAPGGKAAAEHPVSAMILHVAAATRPLERLVWPKPARLPATAPGDFFPPPAMPALHRESKKTARRRQPLRSALRVRAGRPPSDRQPSRPRQARFRGKKGLTL